MSTYNAVDVDASASSGKKTSERSSSNSRGG